MAKSILYSIYITGLVLANVLAYRLGDLFGVNVAGNPIAYVSCFLICDIINERYGLIEAKKLVNAGFIALLAFLGFLYSTYLIPSASPETESAFKTVFDNSWRVIVGSLTAYFVANHVDVHIFNYIRNHGGSKVARKVLSTIVSQSIDSLTFVTIAFAGLVDFKTACAIFIGEYGVKATINLAETPVYCAVTSLMSRSKKLSQTS